MGRRRSEASGARLAWAALAAMLLVAVAARLWRLEALPPGLWFDEAVDANDARAVWQGAREIYFEGNLGREPLYMYALAPAVGLLGPGVLPVRLVSALFGLATVGLTYLLGRSMFGRAVGLYATGFATASYVLLHFSRTGFRAITMPAVLALGLWVAWAGLRRGVLWRAALGGALLGLSLYTYSSSRFVTPPLLAGLTVVALGYPLAGDGGAPLPIRRRLLLAGAMLLAAAIVVAPLALYFRAHPDVLYFRAEKMSFVNPLAGAAARAAWLESIGAIARMFVLSGDGLARHNLPGRPLFDPVAGAAFLLGLIGLLDRRWRVAGLFVLVWLGAAVIPLSFTLENPHHLRAIGALPAIFLIAGVGLASAIERVPRLAPSWRAPPRAAAGALAAAVLVVSTAWTLRDYFWVWANDPETYWLTQGDVAAAAAAMPGLPPADRVYLAADEYRSRPEPFTTLRGEDDRVQAFNGRKGFVFPRPDLSSAIYVMPRSGSAPWQRIERFLPRETLVEQVGGPDGVDALRVYQPPVGALRPAPRRRLEARFGDAVELLGYDLDSPAQPGGDLGLTLYWRILQYRWYPWEWRATLVDPTNLSLSQPVSSDALVANAWRVGDVVASWMDVPTADAPGADVVYLMLDMTDRGEAGRVRAADPAGRDLGARLRLGPTKLRPPPPMAVPADLVARPARFGDAIELLGYRLSATAVRAGGEIEVTLVWRASAPIGADYSFTVQLLDNDGALRAQRDGTPVDGRMPTSLWEPGAAIVDTVRLRVPADAAGSALRMIVGLYDGQSMRRLPVQGDDASGDAARLPTVAVSR